MLAQRLGVAYTAVALFPLTLLRNLEVLGALIPAIRGSLAPNECFGHPVADPQHDDGVFDFVVEHSAAQPLASAISSDDPKELRPNAVGTVPCARRFVKGISKKVGPTAQAHNGSQRTRRLLPAATGAPPAPVAQPSFTGPTPRRQLGGRPLVDRSAPAPLRPPPAAATPALPCPLAAGPPPRSGALADSSAGGPRAAGTAPANVASSASPRVGPAASAPPHAAKPRQSVGAPGAGVLADVGRLLVASASVRRPATDRRPHHRRSNRCASATPSSGASVAHACPANPKVNSKVVHQSLGHRFPLLIESDTDVDANMSILEHVPSGSNALPTPSPAPFSRGPFVCVVRRSSSAPCGCRCPMVPTDTPPAARHLQQLLNTLYSVGASGNLRCDDASLPALLPLGLSMDDTDPLAEGMDMTVVSSQGDRWHGRRGRIVGHDHEAEHDPSVHMTDAGEPGTISFLRLDLRHVIGLTFATK